MPNPNTQLSRGYVIALISAVVLSTTGIFIRYLTQNYHLPALILAFWRDGFVALTLLPVLAILRPALLRVERRHLAYLAAYGLVLALFNASWTLAVSLTGAAVATVLAYCSAAFTALLGWWFLHEQLNISKLMTIALCLAGCALVSGALDAAVWKSNPLGLLTGVLSGLFYAIYSLMGRSASQRGLNPWTSILYTFGIAAVFLFCFNLFPAGLLPGSAARLSDLLWLGNSGSGWGILFLLAAGPTVIGFGLYNTSLSYLPSSVANLIVTIEPVFTAISAYFLFGEALTAIQLTGSLMILGGVIFLRLSTDWQVRQYNRAHETVSTHPSL